VDGHSKTTITADLARAYHIPSGIFDRVVCAQTLQMTYDLRAALLHLQRILKPGGVVLATTHGISHICRRLGRDAWGEYWRLTAQPAERLFGDAFQPGAVSVETQGNVLTATGFLHGLAAEDLRPDQLDYCRSRLRTAYHDPGGEGR
jgi:SAM-dependent methyltransferase